MHLQELSPSCTLTLIRRGFESVFTEDIGNGGAGNTMAKCIELAFDPLVSRVLFSVARRRTS